MDRFGRCQECSSEHIAKTSRLSAWCLLFYVYCRWYDTFHATEWRRWRYARQLALANDCRPQSLTFNCATTAGGPTRPRTLSSPTGLRQIMQFRVCALVQAGTSRRLDACQQYFVGKEFKFPISCIPTAAALKAHSAPPFRTNLSKSFSIFLHWESESTIKPIHEDDLNRGT